MKSKKVILIVIGIALFVSILSYYLVSKTKQSHHDVQTHQVDPCQVTEREQTVNDVYMQGVLEKNQIVKALLNYYACNEIKKNDLVLYRFSEKSEEVIRRVVAVEGDRLTLQVDKRLQGWIIKVNDLPIENVRMNKSGELELGGKPYFFGDPKFSPNLKNYEQAHGGLIQKGHVVVLSSFPPGDRDSGVFGVVSIRDITAKVIKLSY